MTRITDQRVLAEVNEAACGYRESLADERHMHVRSLSGARGFCPAGWSGSGVSATRCFEVGLLFCDGRPLPYFCRVKEARRVRCSSHMPARARFRQSRTAGGHGSAPDAGRQRYIPWLGASVCRPGHDFYVRQLRDMKFSLPVESFGTAELQDYATLCRARPWPGPMPARAIRALISGYLGNSDKFDQAVADFAVAYADQVERNHETLSHAADAGRFRSSRRGSIVRSAGGPSNAMPSSARYTHRRTDCSW